MFDFKEMKNKKKAVPEKVPKMILRQAKKKLVAEHSF